VSIPYPERLYYADPYLTEFEAHVVEHLGWEGHPAVVLDRSAFYPTSGGQPSDRGTICGIPVTGVEVREADGSVVHVLGEGLTADQGSGQVDWERRFDHMQHHTGQHILSAVCEQLLDAETVSFHLGSEMCTIDLDKSRIPSESMEPVESLVNRVIWEDRNVTTRFAGPAEVEGLGLRHPPTLDGPVRLVEVDDLDVNPCGGTHVARTGEIGLLKTVRLDYRGTETRVEFLCGARAVRDYHRKNETLLQLAGKLTVGYWELDDAVTRLQQELKTTQRELRAVSEHALQSEAARCIDRAIAVGEMLVVREVWEARDPSELRALAQGIATHPGTIAMLASLGDRTHICVARSEGLESDAVALLQAACEQLGGKGGGQPHLAQGSAPAADRASIEGAFDRLIANL
jgi:alanyl-tRNA synthetase